MHPAYAIRSIEYTIPGNAYCPLLQRQAKGIRFKLDKELHLIPEAVEVF